MGTPFFSVLMPVYNTEKFLRRAIDSVLMQSFRDFELILVDDCSTDLSSVILAEYQQKDDRVIVVKTKKNSGVANARNTGMKLVSGKYLTFVDSDDYIEKELFANAKKIIDETRAHLVKYSVVEQYYDIDQNYIGKRNVVLRDKVYHTKNDVRAAILPMEKLPLFGYLWNCFYDLNIAPKHLWNFDSTLYVNEDFMMNMKLIDYIDVMACSSYIGYHYEKRINNSLSTKRNEQYYECSKPKIKVLLEKYNEWNLLTNSRKADIYWLYIRIVYSTICRSMNEGSLIWAKEKMRSICQDELYLAFTNDRDIGNYYKGKEWCMYMLLKYKFTGSFLFLCEMISFVKEHCPSVFSKIKE